MVLSGSYEVVIVMLRGSNGTCQEIEICKIITHNLILTECGNLAKMYNFLFRRIIPLLLSRCIQS